MSETPVYVISVELRPLAGCSILDPGAVNGAGVRAFVAAGSFDQAYRRFLDEFSTLKLVVVDVDWIFRSDTTDWENLGDEDQEALEAEAISTGGVVFGTFHTWGHDAPDAYS